MSGGDGRDEVTYERRELPVAVSLNGRADDGSAGEGDDVSGDVEQVTGGVRDDQLTGSDGREALAGGAGSDTLSGLGGDDQLDGGTTDEGADVLRGGAGADTLNGGPGGDVMSGGEGSDALRGGGGTDDLGGDTGDDDVQGEADADTMAGGPGADMLDGGAGADRADYGASRAAVSVSLDSTRNDGENGEDLLRRVENVRGGSGPDTLVGDGLANVLEGGAGADWIDGADGADTVAAGAGKDLVLARDDVRDSVACGTGRDVAIVDELDALTPGPELCERADAGTGARPGEALLQPQGCDLTTRLPGTTRDLVLRSPLSIPTGTTVDARRCAARISAQPRAPSARVRAGAFVLRRVGASRRPLRLALASGSFLRCRQASGSRAVRRLVVQSRGRVTVTGRVAAATGVSAAWSVEDRCGGTAVSVRKRRVRVTRPGRAGAVTVRAGRTLVIPQRAGRSP
jgi:hypothetical protein